MAVRYVQRRLNGGGRSFEEVEPPPESLEVSKYLSSVQRFNKIRGCSFPEAPGSWTSLISGEIVAGHTRHEWDAAFIGKIAVAADIQDEKLMQMVLNGDFKFEEELKSVPSSSMFPCDESSFPPTIHISPFPSPDLAKIHSLNDDEGFQTPNRAIVSVEPTSSESQQPKRRRRKLDLVVSDDQEKRPD